MYSWPPLFCLCVPSKNIKTTTTRDCQYHFMKQMTHKHQKKQKEHNLHIKDLTFKKLNKFRFVKNVHGPYLSHLPLTAKEQLQNISGAWTRIREPLITSPWSLCDPRTARIQSRTETPPFSWLDPRKVSKLSLLRTRRYNQIKNHRRSVRPPEWKTSGHNLHTRGMLPSQTPAPHCRLRSPHRDTDWKTIISVLNETDGCIFKKNTKCWKKIQD